MMDYPMLRYSIILTNSVYKNDKTWSLQTQLNDLYLAKNKAKRFITNSLNDSDSDGD